MTLPAPTARLEFRELVAGDAAFLLRLMTDPSYIANIGDRGLRTVDEAAAFLESGPRAHYAQQGFGLWRLGLHDGTPIGICGLIRRAVLADVDIGYALLPEFTGMGHAREAARGTLDFARDVLGLARLVAVVNPDNARSLRLLADLGFAHEGMVRLAPEQPEICLLGRAL